MKTFIKQLAMLGIALVTLGTATEAAASCTASGKIRAIFSGSNYSYVYFDPYSTTSVPSYTWYVYVSGTNTALVDALAAAHAGDHSINVTGTATTCPTTGSLRYVGVASYGYAYSRY